MSFAARRLALAALLAATSALARPYPPAPPVPHPILLQDGWIVPVSAPPFRGDVLVHDGVIVALGPDLAVPAEAEIVPLEGSWVVPSFIAADSEIGLVEIESVSGTIDTRETGEINPNVRAEVAVNPDSDYFPVARSQGVLLAMSVPQGSRGRGPGGLVAGTSALLRLDGWTWEEMTARAPVGLHVYWPVEVAPTATSDDEEEDEATEGRRIRARSPLEMRRERLALLDETFARARALLTAHDSGAAPALPDVRLEALFPVLRGEIPVFIHANTLGQLREAIAFADRERVSLVLVGALDAPRMARELASRGTPVLYGPVTGLPLRRDDPVDAVVAGPRALHEAGVRFAIVETPDSFTAPGNDRNVPFQAGWAVSHGLPRDIALRSVTLSAAEILGVDDRFGSLAPGKEATLLVASGDPLEITTRIESILIRGRPVALDSRHRDLFEKYRLRLEPPPPE